MGEPAQSTLSQTAPLSVSECVQCLKTLEDHEVGRLLGTYVEVSPTDYGEFKFVVKRRKIVLEKGHYRYRRRMHQFAEIHLVGTLTPLELFNHTLVVWNSRVHPRTFIIGGCVMNGIFLIPVGLVLLLVTAMHSFSNPCVLTAWLWVLGVAIYLLVYIPIVTINQYKSSFEQTLKYVFRKENVGIVGRDSQTRHYSINTSWLKNNLITEKEKRKPKKKLQPDEEFISSSPVEECAVRLKALGRSESFGLLRTTVEISPMVNSIRRFSIERTFFAIGGGFRLQSSGTSRYNYVKIQLEGTLAPLNMFDQTLVTLKSRTHPKTFVVNGCWFVLFGPAIFFVALYFLLEGTIFMALVMCFMLLAAGYLMIYQPVLLGDEYRFELVDEVKHVVQESS